MKAITIIQPFATLVALGEKTIDHRTWATTHRGPLLICAGAKDFIMDDDIAPGGYALATCDLVDCREFTSKDIDASCMDKFHAGFAWMLGNVREIEPFRVKGKQRIFDVDPPFLRDLPGASDSFTHIEFILSLSSVK